MVAGSQLKQVEKVVGSGKAGGLIALTSKWGGGEYATDLLVKYSILLFVLCFEFIRDCIVLYATRLLPAVAGCCKLTTITIKYVGPEAILEARSLPNFTYNLSEQHFCTAYS